MLVHALAEKLSLFLSEIENKLPNKQTNMYMCVTSIAIHPLARVPSDLQTQDGEWH